MKNRQEKGGSVGLRQKTHDFLGGKGRKWERAKITTFQSQVSNWPYRFTDEFVCRIHLKHSGFQRHRGGTESWESWESWERGSSNKRKKEARNWKEDRDRKRGREREKCESHAAALIPACVHPCPSQTTRLAYRECVREKETDRKWARALVNKHTHTRWCVYASVQLCVCVSSPSRSESTWNEGHMRLNTSLVIKQSLVGERFFPEPASNSLCVVEGETKRETDIISENKWKWETMFAAESGLMWTV